MALPRGRAAVLWGSRIWFERRLWLSILGRLPVGCRFRLFRLGHRSLRCAPGKELTCPPLLCLETLDIAAKITDSELLILLVSLFHLTKNRAPHRHLGRSMRRHIGAKFQYGNNVRVRKSPVVPLAQSDQVGRLCFQGGSRRSMTSAVHAVARRAVTGIHLFSAGRRGLVDRDRHLRPSLVGIAKSYGHRRGQGNQ